MWGMFGSVVTATLALGYAGLAAFFTWKIVGDVNPTQRMAGIGLVLYLLAVSTGLMHLSGLDVRMTALNATLELPVLDLN